jgi:hypothetical protein
MQVRYKNIKKLKFSTDKTLINAGTTSSTKNEISNILLDTNIDSIIEKLNVLSDTRTYDYYHNIELDLNVNIFKEELRNKKIPTMLISLDVEFTNGEYLSDIDIWDDINGLYTEVLEKLKQKNLDIINLSRKQILENEARNYLV